MLANPLKENMEAVLSGKEFEKLSKFIYDRCGIKMPPIKKTMLETRLRKRLRSLQIKSFHDYCEYLFSKKGMDEELVHMIDVVTTNKTDFFREPAQFNFLTQKALTDLADNFGAGTEKPLKVWSAGCSTGEEPYSLAIILNEYGQYISGYNYFILATDISTKVLEIAINGIYDIERVAEIPWELKKKYFLKGKNSNANLVKVIPELKKFIQFQRLNFMDNDFGIREKQEIIFCRNVIIYFDRITQERLIKKLLNLLIPGGYLFLGHSETIFKTDIPIEQVAPSSYRKLK
jgi:chemotaxis protein methyltransferase CheR